MCIYHCVKSVRILVRIRSECGKMLTRITPNTDTFHTVIAFIGIPKLSTISSDRIRHFNHVSYHLQAVTPQHLFFVSYNESILSSPLSSITKDNKNVFRCFHNLDNIHLNQCFINCRISSLYYSMSTSFFL